MYKNFYGLNDKPFAITPDPRYLFMSERHGEGLAHLVYGATESGGFIQLTGEVGTGKTMLVRTLLGQLPAEVDVALILNPQLTAIDFLIAINEELSIRQPRDRTSVKSLVDALNKHLLAVHGRGRRTILLVDEAQNLSPDVLEQLRLLTNLETAKHKLLQVILVAQPELREMLSRNELRQLAQRVTGRYHLDPLSREETSQYIDHRLKVAGALSEVFDAGAKRAVFKFSGGLPRLVNIICDRALLGGYACESRTISKALVRRAAAEVSGKRITPNLIRWGIPAIGIASAVVIAFGIRFVIQQQTSEASTLITVALETDRPFVQTAAYLDESDLIDEFDSSTTSLEQRLLRVGPASGLDAAMTTLFQLWGAEYDSDAGAACGQAKAQGLSCYYQRGTWNVIRQLDRPVVLTMTDSNGATHQPPLVSLSANSGVIRIGEARFTYPIEEISELWFGQYMLIWRPYNGNATEIRRGMRSPSVRWLRQSLAEINAEFSPILSDSDLYDAELEQQLMDFQRRNRLQVDGLAGQQTQIMINSLLAVEGAPRLVK